jgi:superfamily II DNA or RNA helicase
MVNTPDNEQAKDYLTRLSAQCLAQSSNVRHFSTNANLARLDDHQTDAMENIAGGIDGAITSKTQDIRMLINHCCGSGKTWVQTNLAIASRRVRAQLGNIEGKDLLVVTERAPLLQLEDYCNKAGLDAGVWGAGRRILDRPTLITTIQALQVNRKNLKRILGEKAHLLIGDEADLYMTAARKGVVDDVPALLKVGFTGTAELPDGRHASDTWGEVVSSLSLRDGILQGKNVPPYYYLYGANIDESSFEMKGEDYDPTTISAALSQVEIWNALPDLYERLIPIDKRKELQALVCLPTTELVRSVTEEFQQRYKNLEIRYWTGEDTSSDALEQDIETFDQQNVHILSLCEMGGRSLNFVTARVMFDCYPTQSRRKFEQRVARVMRRVWPGSDLYKQGIRKDTCSIVQIVPTRRRESHYFRPVTLPDILGEDTWSDAQAGRPLLASRRAGTSDDAGAPLHSDIVDLRDQILDQDPRYTLQLIQELDVLRELRTRGNLPRADLGGGKFYLGRRYARRRTATE